MNMEPEILAEYMGARVVHSDDVKTPNLLMTLPVPVKENIAPFFSMHEGIGNTVLLPSPDYSAVPLQSNTHGEERKESTPNSIYLQTGAYDLRDVKIPQSHIVYIFGAEGLYRSQTKLMRLLITLRSHMRRDQILFLPGLALPHRYGIYSLLGVDLFDTAPIVQATREELFLTNEGWLPLQRMKDPVFHGETLLEHNTNTAFLEAANVRQAIHSDTLRTLVEARSAWDPWSSSVLRILDRDWYGSVEPFVPVVGDSLPAPLPHAVDWPEVRRYRERYAERYRRPELADVLLLLPCSATKPYSMSRGHKTIRSILWDAGMASRVHVVVVTSPLGIVPGELETYYPCMQYDTAVTGDWTREEKETSRAMLERLLSHPYSHTIVHLPEDYDDTVPDLDGDVVHTCAKRIASFESLRNLDEALQSIEGRGSGKEDMRERLRQDMTSRLAYQFGSAGEALMEGAGIRGRYPDLKIIARGVQRGMLTRQRGMVSLTLEGADILARQSVYSVEIEDFEVKGDIFAIGVKEASEDIRIGDDVVVKHGEEVRGVGVAAMSYKAMIEGKRGVAVKIRKHA